MLHSPKEEDDHQKKWNGTIKDILHDHHHNASLLNKLDLCIGHPKDTVDNTLTTKYKDSVLDKNIIEWLGFINAFPACWPQDKDQSRMNYLCLAYF